MLNQSKNVYHLYRDETIDDYLDYEYDGVIDLRDKIEDVDNFKLQLKRQNMLDKKLEAFIDNYLMFDNE